MNIFVLSNELENIPQYLVDKHINAQIKEGAQMLSTTFWAYDKGLQLYNNNLIYKPSHYNHPCSIWTRQSLDNWLWLKDFIIYIHKERMYRFPNRNPHKSFLLTLNMPTPTFLPNIGLTPFVKAMPDYLKQLNVVKAYRQYYNSHKRHLFSWTNRKIPEWIRSA